MKASGQLHAMTALLLGKNPGMRCIGVWVDLRACLGVLGEGKNLFPLSGFELRIVQPID
jgi:hypothetical protein